MASDADLEIHVTGAAAEKIAEDLQQKWSDVLGDGNATLQRRPLSMTGLEPNDPMVALASSCLVLKVPTCKLQLLMLAEKAAASNRLKPLIDDLIAKYNTASDTDICVKMPSGQMRPPEQVDAEKVLAEARETPRLQPA